MTDIGTDIDTAGRHSAAPSGLETASLQPGENKRLDPARVEPARGDAGESVELVSVEFLKHWDYEGKSIAPLERAKLPKPVAEHLIRVYWAKLVTAGE